MTTVYRSLSVYDEIPGSGKIFEKKVYLHLIQTIKTVKFVTHTSSDEILK